MITPKAFGQIIRHFDEVDKIVSSRTMRKRPWLEVALTSLLCDLLDEETQEEEKLTYTFKQLQEDLRSEDDLFGLHLSLETIEFNPIYERYVSQSDIALNLIFENRIEPETSWTRPYLLQAKRLSPKQLNPLKYSESSSFISIAKDQQKRIEILNKVLGFSYLKYLLFCPRPDYLDNDTKTKIAYLRNKSLSNQIFDYTVGLEAHKELLKDSETFKAGIFVTDTDNSNLNFGELHNKLLNSTFPLSWFIAMNFSDRHDFLREISGNRKPIDNDRNSKRQEIVEGILSGDRRKIDDLIKRINEVGIEVPDNIQILPKHKITIRYVVGEQLSPDNQRLRNQ